MDFDIVLSEIGSFGRYQAFLVLAAIWSMIPIGCNISAVVFLAYEESSRCFLPTVDVTNGGKPDNDVIAQLIPRDGTGQAFSSCTQYNYGRSVGKNNTNTTAIPPTTADVACAFNGTNPLCYGLNVTAGNLTGIPSITSCSNGYVHGKETFVETIASEWDLVCDKSELTSLSASIFCLGMLIGSVIGGSIADRYGRIPTMVCGTIMNIGIAVACSFSPNFIVFVILRFLIGAVAVAIQIAMSVYTVEIIGKRWRPWVGLQVGVFSGLGYMFLSVLAYLSRHWRTLQLMLGLSFIPFLLFAPFMPESPRYLFAKGEVEKAKEVCRLMAKRNGRTLNEAIWKKAAASNTRPVTKIVQSSSPIELCRGIHLSLLLVRMIELWFINSLVFFCLAFNAGNWSGNPFLNNCFSGLAECIACLMVVPAINKFGRRAVIMFCLTVAGVFMLIAEALKASFPPSEGRDITGVALLLVAKFTVSASFNLMFLYTSEMFPTSVRNTALGVSSTGGRFASIISPFLIQLKTGMDWIIPVTLGLLSIASAGLAYWCPETKKVSMLSTMEEAKTFYSSQRRRSSRLKSISSINNNNREDFVPPSTDSTPMLDEETKI